MQSKYFSKSSVCNCLLDCVKKANIGMAYCGPESRFSSTVDTALYLDCEIWKYDLRLGSFYKTFTCIISAAVIKGGGGGGVMNQFKYPAYHFSSFSW